MRQQKWEKHFSPAQPSKANLWLNKFLNLLTCCSSKTNMFAIFLAGIWDGHFQTASCLWSGILCTPGWAPRELWSMWQWWSSRETGTGKLSAEETEYGPLGETTGKPSKTKMSVIWELWSVQNISKVVGGEMQDESQVINSAAAYSPLLSSQFLFAKFAVAGKSVCREEVNIRSSSSCVSPFGCPTNF